MGQSVSKRVNVVALCGSKWVEVVGVSRSKCVQAVQSGGSKWVN